MALTLAARLRSGDCLFSGWIGFPEPLNAEIAARSGFDCVTLDMQHGLQDAHSVMRSIGAVAFGGRPAIVRVPVGDFAMASRALDMGAEAVIAPMINSVADAQAFVAATKYPPVGERSWGPTRALSVLGIGSLKEQLDIANAGTLAFAMIETGRALEALDAILAVDGIDGVFMGPSDLSLTLSAGTSIAPTDKALDQPIARIAERARAAGKIAGAFAVNSERAAFFRDLGYRLIAVGTDQLYLSTGIAAMLAPLRGKG